MRKESKSKFRKARITHETRRGCTCKEVSAQGSQIFRIRALGKRWKNFRMFLFTVFAKIVPVAAKCCNLLIINPASLRKNEENATSQHEDYKRNFNFSFEEDFIAREKLELQYSNVTH